MPQMQRYNTAGRPVSVQSHATVLLHGVTMPLSSLPTGQRRREHAERWEHTFGAQASHGAQRIACSRPAARLLRGRVGDVRALPQALHRDLPELGARRVGVEPLPRVQHHGALGQLVQRVLGFGLRLGLGRVVVLRRGRGRRLRRAAAPQSLPGSHAVGRACRGRTALHNAEQRCMQVVGMLSKSCRAKRFDSPQALTSPDSKVIPSTASGAR